jgi:hypothetical protein
MIAELWDNTRDVHLTVCNIGGGDCNLTLNHELSDDDTEISIEVGIDELCAAAAAILTEAKLGKALSK